MAQLKDTTVTGDLSVSGMINGVKTTHSSTLQTISTTVEINPNILNEEVTLFTIPAGYRGFLIQSSITSDSCAIGVDNYSTTMPSTPAVLTFYWTPINAGSESDSTYTLNANTAMASVSLSPYIKSNTTIRCKVTTAGVGYSNKVVLQANLILQPI